LSGCPILTDSLVKKLDIKQLLSSEFRRDHPAKLR